MLAIGRALMTNPELLILDEATEGLAPLIVREIWRIIGEIRPSGIASLIVDRNYRRCSRTPIARSCMEKGAVVLEGWSASLAQRADVLGRHLGVTQVGLETRSRRHQSESVDELPVGLHASKRRSPGIGADPAPVAGNSSLTLLASAPARARRARRAAGA